MSKSVAEFTKADVPLLRDFLLEAWRQAGPLSFGWTGATDENISEIASEKFLKDLLATIVCEFLLTKTIKRFWVFVQFEL